MQSQISTKFCPHKLPTFPTYSHQMVYEYLVFNVLCLLSCNVYKHQAHCVHQVHNQSRYDHESFYHPKVQQVIRGNTFTQFCMPDMNKICEQLHGCCRALLITARCTGFPYSLTHFSHYTSTGSLKRKLCLRFLSFLSIYIIYLIYK